VVVSGRSWSTGAARLAARGALRAGAGLVTIASPREALAVNAATNLAVIVRPVDGPDELARFLADVRLNALALNGVNVVVKLHCLFWKKRASTVVIARVIGSPATTVTGPPTSLWPVDFIVNNLVPSVAALQLESSNVAIK
jgi:NAD(P)H-hydrate repair Nnr-like enzyme with NAD(P)H-hydrate dehydratase domain